MYGMEIGFMEKGITDALENGDLNVSQPRLHQRRIDLLNRLHFIPNQNCSDIDYEKDIHDLQFLYKQSRLKINLKSKADANDSQNVADW